MEKVSVVITDKFEDVKFTSPQKVIAVAGHELVSIECKGGKTAIDQTDCLKGNVEQAMSDENLDDFDTLFISGGFRKISKLRL